MADPPARPRRLVLAHGFTQTARSWEVVEELLRRRLPATRTVAVDLPGHGTAADVRVRDLWGAAEHLVAAGGTGTYVGYSMGGRVALHAALTRPEQVERLVLIGATAGIDDPAERAARRAADDALATRIEEIGTEAFVDEWLTAPLFAGLTPATARREDRLRNRPAGLAASLRTTGTGTQDPLWDRLGDVAAPVLVLVGADDEKFCALGARLVDALPHAEEVVIEGAGHSVHLERPEATVEALADWLEGRATT